MGEEKNLTANGDTYIFEVWIFFLILGELILNFQGYVESKHLWKVLCEIAFQYNCSISWHIQ